jgi:hypothetical protein
MIHLNSLYPNALELVNSGNVSVHQAQQGTFNFTAFYNVRSSKGLLITGKLLNVNTVELLKLQRGMALDGSIMFLHN